MKASRFLLAPVFSIFDLNIYREARGEKFGTAVLYSLYLSALFCLALTVFAVSFMPQANAFADWLKNEWPGFTLTATGMKLDKPGPVTLVHPKFGALIAFDDSRSTVTDSEMDAVNVFVTSNMIYTKTRQGVQARMIPGAPGNSTKASFKKDTRLHIDGKQIQTLYQKFKWAVVGIFLLTMLIFGLIMRLVTGLIFGLLGFLLQLAVPRNLDYEKLFVLASFALSVGLIFGIFQYVPLVARFFPAGAGLILSLVYFGIAIAVQPKITASSN